MCIRDRDRNADKWRQQNPQFFLFIKEMYLLFYINVKCVPNFLHIQFFFKNTKWQPEEKQDVSGPMFIELYTY